MSSGYAKTRGVSFRAKNVPLVYLPYMLWPVKTSRVSGFLMPKPGFSTRRGPLSRHRLLLGDQQELRRHPQRRPLRRRPGRRRECLLGEALLGRWEPSFATGPARGPRASSTAT